MEYPSRPQFYAHRITRLLFKSCAAQSIGQDAVLLIIHIAHTEDAARYQAPVRFWNSQLNEVLGFRSPKSLNNARQKAVESGWLHYERKNDRSDGKYWTLIPAHVAAFDDEPIEPISPIPESIPRTESIPSTEREAEQDSYALRNRKVTGNDLLPIPVPNPIDIPSLFAEWYSYYPRKVSKDDALKEYPKALARIAKADNITLEQAAKVLLSKTLARLPALKATERQFVLHPNRYLSKSRYDDEIDGTQVSLADRPEYAKKARPPARKRA